MPASHRKQIEQLFVRLCLREPAQRDLGRVLDFHTSQRPAEEGAFGEHFGAKQKLFAAGARGGGC